MLTDYHMHLERGGLDPAYLLHFVETARRNRIDEIGFTEHAYHFVEAAPLLNRPEYVARRSGGYRLDDYLRLLVEARASGVPVRVGIEMDYVEEREADIARFLAAHPWDFVIGSVHWIGDWGFDLDPDSWRGRDVEEAYRAYFERAERAIRSRLFDVFGHPDVIKVFGRRPAPAFAPVLVEFFDRLANAARDAGVCLEVSSAGLRKPVGEIYPDLRLLRRARDLGVPITLASDAHEPDHVGWAFRDLVAFVRSAGYEFLTVFDGRRARQERLG